jgi:hypothetical protein
MKTDRVECGDLNLPVFDSEDARLFDIESPDEREEKLTDQVLNKVAEVTDGLLNLAEDDLGITQMDQHFVRVRCEIHEDMDSDPFDEIGFCIFPKQNRSAKGLRDPGGKLLKQPSYDLSNS